MRIEQHHRNFIKGFNEAFVGIGHAASIDRNDRRGIRMSSGLELSITIGDRTAEFDEIGMLYGPVELLQSLAEENARDEEQRRLMDQWVKKPTVQCKPVMDMSLLSAPVEED